MAFQQISDRSPFVQKKLGNRSDLVSGVPSRIDIWLRDAYLELTYAYPFDELLSKTDVTTVITVPTDTYSYPSGVRALRGVSGIDTSVTPNQSFVIERKNIRYLDTFTPTQARPSMYATYPLQVVGPPPSITRQIVLRPVPDKVYTIRLRTWILPTIAGTVSATFLQMPDDWLEILDYSAALRGHTELLETDKAQSVQQLLYGYIDPRSGKHQPGMIAARMTSMQAEYEAGEMPLGELSRPATSKGRG